MSNSIFNVFDESYLPQQTPSKNLGQWSHLSRPLRGKSAVNGGATPSQKRVLCDLSNKIAHPLPTSGKENEPTKLQATEQIVKGFKDNGNFNTPKNRLPVSSMQKSSTKSHSKGLNMTNSIEKKNNISVLEKNTQVFIKEKGLSVLTPDIRSNHKTINYLDEPEIFPDGSSTSFCDDVIPKHLVTKQEFDSVFDCMNYNFRPRERTIHELPELKFIESDLLFSDDDMLTSSFEITEYSIPDIPDIDD